MRKIWIAVILVVGAALSWWFLHGRPAAVDLANVTRGPVREVVEEEGETRVTERFVVSAPVDGRLERLELDAADPVEKGQVVAQIDPLPLQTTLAETRARIRSLEERKSGVDTKRPKPEEIERAKNLETQADEASAVARHQLEQLVAAHEKAGKDLERVRSTVRQQVEPVTELDAAVAAEAESRAQVEAQEVRVKIADLATGAARLERQVLVSRLEDFDWEEKDYAQQIAALEAELSKVEDDLHRTDIRAPVAGVVLRRDKESEQVVSAGTSILEIGNLARLEVQADFLSEDAAHMRKGMPAEVFGRSLGTRVVSGTISRIHPSAFTKVSSLGVEQQRVTVVVEVDAEDTGLGDRYRVQVRAILDARDEAVLVPEGALFRQEGTWHAFRVTDGAADLVAVTTGIGDGRNREVLSGLAPGDRVILHPDATITEGTPVKSLPP